jgi:hypothetical protein
MCISRADHSGRLNKLSVLLDPLPDPTLASKGTPKQMGLRATVPLPALTSLFLKVVHVGSFQPVCSLLLVEFLQNIFGDGPSGFLVGISRDAVLMDRKAGVRGGFGPRMPRADSAEAAGA